jgi:CDGSH-type Zn-finger protein
VRMTPIRNGPLLVRGRIEVTRDDGTSEVLPRASLCRCGQSANKPFCDNKHIGIGFRAPGEAFHIELSPVRLQPELPMEKAVDPRGD